MRFETSDLKPEQGKSLGGIPNFEPEFNIQIRIEKIWISNKDWNKETKFGIFAAYPDVDSKIANLSFRKRKFTATAQTGTETHQITKKVKVTKKGQWGRLFAGPYDFEFSNERNAQNQTVFKIKFNGQALLEKEDSSFGVTQDVGIYFNDEETAPLNCEIPSFNLEVG